MEDAEGRFPSSPLRPLLPPPPPHLPPYPRFSRSGYTCDLNISIVAGSLSGTWLYKVSTRTGRLGVSTLRQSKIVTVICSFCVSVAARTIVHVDVKYQTIKQQSVHTSRGLSNSKQSKTDVYPKNSIFLSILSSYSYDYQQYHMYINALPCASLTHKTHESHLYEMMAER